MATIVNRRTLREGAASDLGLFLSATADAVDTTQHTIKASDLISKLSDQFQLQDAWASPAKSTSTGNQFRRIVKPYLDTGTQQIMLDGGPDSLSNGDRFGVYFLLTPEEWNEEINNALMDCFKPMRVSITLVAGDNEYAADALTDSESDLCTWLQSRSQILGLTWRYANGALSNFDRDWPGVRYLGDNNSFTIQLSQTPGPITGSTLTLLARKPYVWPGKLLDSDVSGGANVYQTNMPYRFAMAAVQEAAMRKLFVKHGVPAMRARFAATLASVREMLQLERQRWEPPLQPASYQKEENWRPDIPLELLHSSW